MFLYLCCPLAGAVRSYEAPTAEVFNEFLDIKPASAAAQVSFASSPSLPRSAVSGSLSR